MTFNCGHCFRVIDSDVEDWVEFIVPEVDFFLPGMKPGDRIHYCYECGMIISKQAREHLQHRVILPKVSLN